VNPFSVDAFLTQQWQAPLLVIVVILLVLVVADWIDRQ